MAKTARELIKEAEKWLVKSHRSYKYLIQALAALDAEQEEKEFKPLLFQTLLGFRIIISKEVPNNEIWFATQAQLEEALDYSQKQIEQALNKGGAL